MVTPPPVPRRTPPVVPKRSFISNQTNCKPQHMQSTQHEKFIKFTQQQKLTLNNQQQQISKQIQRRASLNNEIRDDEDWLDKPKMQAASQSPIALVKNYPTILPPINQKTRQAIRNQMSIDASKQLQNSAVLKSDNYRVQNGSVSKIQPILNQQYSSKQSPVVPAINVNTAAQNSITKQQSVSSDRVIDTTAYTILYNPTGSLQRKSKTSEKAYNCANIMPTRKILPPPPTEPPPTVPKRKPVTETNTKITTNTASSDQCASDTNTTVALLLSCGTVKTSQSTSKAGKPPPLMQVNTTSMQKSPSNNKVSIRQDSSISSDSFSQTSSPSYTTKTMETPLLPHSSRYCNGKMGHKQNSTLLAKNNAEAFDIEKDGKHNSSALTKSISTPASLQTIVRFHNGSNMSLHHRVSFARL